MVGPQMKALVDKYFGKIEVVGANYVPVDDAKSDAAELTLIVPKEMLYECFRTDPQKRLEDFFDIGLPRIKLRYPERDEFWRETGLLKRIREVQDRYNVAELSDILDFLDGKVWVEYQDLNGGNLVRVSITEVPEFYTDEELGTSSTPKATA